MTKQQLIDILQQYHTGLEVVDVVLRVAKAPEEVKDAFDDATKAQEEEQRLQNEAAAYANRVIPEARGKAHRLLAEAEAYQQQVVLDAQADTVRFNAVYNRYREAPRVMRERMYFDAMESVLSKTTKLLLDSKGGGNMFYIPLTNWFLSFSNAGGSALKNIPQPAPVKNYVEATPEVPDASKLANPPAPTPSEGLRQKFLSRERYLQTLRGKPQ